MAITTLAIHPHDALHEFDSIHIQDKTEVEKILTLFDCKSINDGKHFVWGFRQPYSFLHLAAHPQVHLIEENLLVSPNSQVTSQIAIIRLPGNCGADPELVVSQQLYTTPAIAAGNPMGHTHFFHKQAKQQGILIKAPI